MDERKLRLKDILPKRKEPLAEVVKQTNESYFVCELASAAANMSGIFRVGCKYLSEHAGTVATRLPITKAAEAAATWFKHKTGREVQPYYINPCKELQEEGKKTVRTEGLYLTKFIVPILRRQGYIQERRIEK